MEKLKMITERWESKIYGYDAVVYWSYYIGLDEDGSWLPFHDFSDSLLEEIDFSDRKSVEENVKHLNRYGNKRYAVLAVADVCVPDKGNPRWEENLSDTMYGKTKAECLRKVKKAYGGKVWDTDKLGMEW